MGVCASQKSWERNTFVQDSTEGQNLVVAIQLLCVCSWCARVALLFLSHECEGDRSHWNSLEKFGMLATWLLRNPDCPEYASVSCVRQKCGRKMDECPLFFSGVNREKKAAGVINAMSFALDIQFPECRGAFARGTWKMFVIWQGPSTPKLTSLVD